MEWGKLLMSAFRISYFPHYIRTPVSDARKPGVQT